MGYARNVTVSVVRGTNDKPAASQALIEAFQRLTELEGELFVGFPVFAAEGAVISADAIFLSVTHGPILIDLVEGEELGDYESRQDDLARLLQSRLLNHRGLVKRRKLLVEPQTLTFAPAVPPQNEQDADYLFANASNLGLKIDQMSSENLPPNIYDRLISAIQNISTLRGGRRTRTSAGDGSRGDRLLHLEQQIATLDPRQSAAVLETIEGVQRIRGLAGSGKTIVLALKAAYLHAQHPEWRIAVTYNTRSLQEQFKRLINGFVIEQTGDEPDWTMLRIVNAWGGRAEQPPGIYFEFCTSNGIDPYDYGSARRAFGYESAFDGACSAALAMSESATGIYDAILIDEAQDLPASFLRLCWQFLKPPGRLIYAYDELQTLSGTGLPSVEEIFGRDEHGEALVHLDASPDGTEGRSDIVLQKCYRNSGPVLVTAHALGFGVYRQPTAPSETGLVQMFDQPDLWEDIGYQVVSGALEPAREVALERTAASSPTFLEDHSPIDDLIQFHSFETRAEQDAWVAEQIRQNLGEDKLRHDDIVVINPDPISTRENVGGLRRRLAETGIDSHLAGVDTALNVFFTRDRDSITFTGVFRAKGNEAGMVYVINSDEGLGRRQNLALVRNRLFTAITRSKAWVRVLGVGPHMKELEAEFAKVKEQAFRLRFNYPTEQQREEMRILHRELSKDALSELERGQASAQGLLADLEGGRLFVQDLDSDVRARLRELLDDSEG